MMYSYCKRFMCVYSWKTESGRAAVRIVFVTLTALCILSVWAVFCVMPFRKILEERTETPGAGSTTKTLEIPALQFTSHANITTTLTPANSTFIKTAAWSQSLKSEVQQKRVKSHPESIYFLVALGSLITICILLLLIECMFDMISSMQFIIVI